MIATDLQMAGRSLAQHTKRTLFLSSAIALVTALLVLLGGVAAGIRSSMLESALILMSGHVNVGGFYKITSGMAAPLVVDYDKVLAEVKKSVPELEFSTVRGRGYAKGVSETGSMDLIVGGMDIMAEPGFRRVILPASGSLDELAKPNTILLFEDQAKRLGLQVGDALTISAPTARGTNNTADVRVAVIAKNLGLLSSMMTYVPNVTLQQLYQLKETTTGAIHLYLRDAAASASVAARLRTALAAGGWRVMDPDPEPYWQKLMNKVPQEDWTGQKLDVTTWEDEMSFMSWILNAVQGLTGLLITILMAIVIIGIMNTMWIAIRERTREIGTMRAIGMHRRRVLWQLLLEALLLGILGTAGGMLLGVGVAALVNAAHIGVPEAVQVFLLAQHLTLAVSLRTVLADALVIVIVTTLAALYPAIRAARLKPITAMHHAG
jgi:putative ABC transport system permease protein